MSRNIFTPPNSGKDDERDRILEITTPSNPGNDDELMSRQNLLGRIRDVRAEAQNLQRSLLEIKEKSELTDPAVRNQELRAALLDNATIMVNNKDAVQIHLAKARKLLETRPWLYDRYGDTVTQIENSWERATKNWPLKEVNENLALKVTTSGDSMNEMIYYCALLTIPERVNQHLENKRIGQILDFHEAFTDELPLKEDRERVLTFLHSQPVYVKGVVDPKKGVIYKASGDKRERGRSFILLLSIFLLGFLLMFLLPFLGEWLRLSNWQITADRRAELYISYLAVAAGGIAHILIDILKERNDKSSTFTALEDIWLWIHVKEFQLLGGVLVWWAAAIILALSTNSVEMQTAFLVGYSSDSFADLFLKRFTKEISSQTEAVKKKFGLQ